MLTRGIRRTAVLTAVVGLTAVYPAGEGGRAAARPLGQPRFVASALTAVSMVPHSRAAWALEARDTRQGAQLHDVVHRVGGHWKRLPLKSSAGRNVYDVAAGSAKAIWAVGSIPYGDAAAPFIEHSTGGAFTPESVKDLSGSDLIAVAASSASNVWAVGDTRTFTGGTPFVAHRVGGTWESVSDTVQNGFGLNAVSTSGGRNVWILGTKSHSDDVAVWNGHSLSSMPLPVPRRTSVQDVATTGANDTWVVGWTERKPGTHDASFIEHWNGHAWKRYRAPSPMYNSTLTSVSAAGRNVYAVGTGLHKSPLDQTTTPYLLRFVHGKWVAVHTPTRSKSSRLLAVSVSSKAGAAVGEYTGTTSRHQPTQLSFATVLVGKTWKAVPV